MMSSGAISVRSGMFPEMKTTEPYSPSARANASANPVTAAGHEDREEDVAEGLPAARAEHRRRLLELRVEVLEHRLHRPDDEGQADEGERDRDAERRERHAAPRAARGAGPTQPFLE